MRDPFLERLEKRVLVCDGAMGTELYARGIAFSHSFDELNLSRPQIIKEIHLSYVKAGAEVIETNTFGANRFRLAKFELGDKVREINLAGAKLAREIAGDDLYVAGSVGPLGLRLEPLGPTSMDEARETFRDQIAVLIEGGVDLIVVETMIDPNEARAALAAAREAGPLPVVVQMTIEDDGSTQTGSKAEDIARELEHWGADVVGLNCGTGPAALLDAIERMAAATTRKLSAQPNAGLPDTIEGRSIYLCSPEYMAGYARRFIDAGVRLIGGCCGTTPAHIQAIKSAVRSLRLPSARASVEVRPERHPARLEPVPIPERSRLGARLARGEFAMVAEIVPPKGSDVTRELEGARYLLEQHIDAVVVPDGAGSTPRLSAQSLAVLLEQKVGVESLMLYSCRDRTVLRMQSDLLGAHALGLRNVLAITGDPPTQTPYPGSGGVFDVDSIGLVNVLSNLNRGLDVGGNPLGTRTAFLIGVGVNPFAPAADEHLRRFAYKVEAGANFTLTQPVFDVAHLKAFLQRIRHFQIPVLATIVPLTSFRNAEFMNNEMPGIHIPEPILDRMRRADTGDRGRAEGIKIAQEILLEVRDLVQGAVISAPLGRYAMVAEVASALEVGAARLAPAESI